MSLQTRDPSTGETVDLEEEYGVLDADVEGLRDAAEFDYATAAIPGVEGVVHLSQDDEGQEGPRLLTVGGHTRVAFNPESTKHSRLLAQIEALKERLLGRELQVVFGDNLSWYFTGRLRTMENPPVRPYGTQRLVGIRWVFFCADPYAYATSETVVDFTSAAAQTPTASGRSWAVFSGVGPVTDLTLIRRNSDGAETGRLGLEGAIGAGVAWSVDMRTQQIVVNGSPAPGYLKQGVEGGDFFAFEPREAAYGGAGPYGTVEWAGSGTLAQAIATYRQRRR